MDRDADQKSQAVWDSMIEEIKGGLQNPEAFDEELFLDLTIAATDMESQDIDFEQVMNKLERYNPDAFKAPQVDEPPPEMAEGSSAPPEKVEHGNIGDAIKDYLNEERARKSARP